MRNALCLCLIVLLLCGCGAEPAPTTVPTTEPTTVPTTVPATTVPETTVPETTVPETTLPPHSALYLPEYTVEQIIEYFNEVVLHVEYSDGVGDSTLVQKWYSPMHYRIEGEPTERDLAVLEGFLAELNAVPGFPGMQPCGEDEFENVTFSFLDHEAFYDAFSEILQGEDAYGGVQFWYYTDTNEIHTGRIGCRTDIPQEERDSIIPEEIINMLGITDTELREDSIVYQYSNENLSLSDVDRVILELLYSDEIASGMTLEECETVIRELYY